MTAQTAEADISELLLKAQRGEMVRISGQAQLAAFARHAIENGEVLRNIEAYELRGELEIPRIDLGLYQGAGENAEQPSAVRLAASKSRLAEILEDADREEGPFVYQVWTDKND